MNVNAHAILYLTFSLQLCDLDATFLFWCRKPKQQRISILHVLRRSCLEMPRAYKWDPCLWIGMLIILAVPNLPDLRCLLQFPAVNNNSVLFQFLHVPA